MAGKFNKKKKSRFVPPISFIKPENFILKNGRSLPIYECRMMDGWFEGGKNQIMVVRRMPNNNFVVGFYLIDLWCLGLKDTFFNYDLTKLEYEDVVDRIIAAEAPSTVIPPAKAFNLIYAAIEYAEDLGFEPAKDFKVTQFLLDDVESIEYMEIETGLNGRPCYYPGPDDNVQAILNKLDKKVGKGNYAYMEFDAPDTLGGGPSKKQIIEQFFPDKKMDKKLATLQDEGEKTNFMLQTVVLTMALEMADGSIDRLAEEYDDDFLEELFEEFKYEMEGMREMDGLPPMEYTEDLKNETRSFINFIVKKTIRHGSVDFMFEKDYKPHLDINPDDIMNLPSEKLEEIFLDAFDLMSDEDKELALFRLKTLTVLNAMLIDEPELNLHKVDRDKLLVTVVEGMQENDQNEYWANPNKKLMDACLKTIEEVIETFEKEQD